MRQPGIHDKARESAEDRALKNAQTDRLQKILILLAWCASRRSDSYLRSTPAAHKGRIFSLTKLLSRHSVVPIWKDCPHRRSQTRARANVIPSANASNALFHARETKALLSL